MEDGLTSLTAEDAENGRRERGKETFNYRNYPSAIRGVALRIVERKKLNRE